METDTLYMLINLILWIYFISVYYDEKKPLFAVFQFMVSLPLILALLSIAYFTNNLYSLLVVYAIILCSFFTLIFAYLYKKQEDKQKQIRH